jgi:hypothetical protein
MRPLPAHARDAGDCRLCSSRGVRFSALYRKILRAVTCRNAQFTRKTWFPYFILVTYNLLHCIVDEEMPRAVELKALADADET